MKSGSPVAILPNQTLKITQFQIVLQIPNLKSLGPHDFFRSWRIILHHFHQGSYENKK